MAGTGPVVVLAFRQVFSKGLRVPDVSAPLAPQPPVAPLHMDLPQALRHIDRSFGIDRILAEEGVDIVTPYYIQSERGYRRVHSSAGAIHMALNTDGRFDPDGFYTHSRAVAGVLRARSAGSDAQSSEGQGLRVLELGCGTGFNALALAREFPHLRIDALDLLAHHVEKATAQARDLPNLRFTQGSFEAIPPELAGADLIFAVETLCHAHDIDKVAQQIADALAPGGQVLIWDAYRSPDFDRKDAQIKQATRLFEITTAVNQGFRPRARWEDALRAAGLKLQPAQDLTWQTLPSLRRLHGYATRYFTSWKHRLLRPFLPRYLALNAVAGLLGPFVAEADTGGAQTETACLGYHLLSAEKPLWSMSL